jgi:hypothetical protein
MSTLFLACALIGVAVLLLQLLLGALGMGHGGVGDLVHDPGAAGHALDHDLTHGEAQGGEDGAHGSVAHANPLWFLSLRSVAAGLAFFGVAGLFALHAGWGRPLALGGALALAAIAALAVAMLQRSMTRLESDAVLRLDRAVGVDGTVHVSIPAGGEEAGKVLLTVQGRRVEVNAVTRGEALASGTIVTVLDLRAPDTVEVCAATALLPDPSSILSTEA